MRSPPIRLEWYIASSASLMISSDSCVCGSDSASPIEAVRKISRSLKAIGARMVLRMVSAKAVMRAGSCSDIRIRPNWSPASRARVSCGLRMRVSRRASVSRIESPTAMPTESLTCLKRSRSITISVGRRFGMVFAKLANAPRRSMNNLRFGRPVRLSCTESWSRRSSAFLISVTSVSVPTTRETSPSEPTTGRAFSANHMKCPSGAARITAFAETIRKTIRAPIAFNDREIFLTASIGLALSDPQTQLTDEIIKDAELAMYHSKRIGGDRIDVYKPAMRARKTDRLTLESELRRAIEREEITILYQPIVRLEDRSIAGFEALARWDHPKLGRMSPVEFISIAEEIGLIVDLGTFVLDRTARQLAIWQRAMRSREPIFASVNVSSRQLLRHDLIHDIRTVLSRSSVARGTLKLELTESLVMENPEHAAQMLTRIRELGTGLSLDDFGTGHSSLAYLQRFPFDTIKIDQSFVRTTSRGTRPVILKSIIALAHDLGMDVVAEGAETDSDAVELYQLGCEYAQGFVFGEPMTPERARELLQPHAKAEMAR